MGQPHITLTDGREIFFAGEHEDFYDPDFYIYNDVVVIDGDQIEVYGYPVSVFPPTDFHTATLFDDCVILIGNLGYPDDRRIGETQVLKLDLESFEISSQRTCGDSPGWLHEHTSVLNESADAIRVSGGKRYGERITENFHDYELCLKTFQWRVAVERKWKSWILERQDGESNSLWQIRQELLTRQFGFSTADHLSKVFKDLPDDLVAEMAFKATEQQLEGIEKLYRSPFDGADPVEDGETFGRYCISVDGIVVRFDEDMDGITMTVEGELPNRTIDSVLSAVIARLEAIENSKYKTTSLDM